jgi:dynein heavy chain
MSNLRHFYDPIVLQDNYKFTESGIYKSPVEGIHSDYVEYINSLPNSEGPDVFGMHENALITFQLQESNKISNVVLSIQPRATGSSGGKSPDKVVGELAEKISLSLPGLLTPHDIEAVEPIFGENGQMSSLMVVLFQVEKC